MGDLSSQSGDHGVPVNPAAASASKWCAVRPRCCTAPTPSAASSTSSPTRFPPSGHRARRATSRSTSAATAARAAARATSTSATASSPSTSAARPTARATTTRPRARSTTRSRGWRWGRSAASWTGEHSYVGASYGYDDIGIRHPRGRGGHHPADAAAPFASRPAPAPGSCRWVAAVVSRHARRARYQHPELEGDEVGTTFHNDTVEGEVLLSHKQVGALVGSVGGWFLNRAFEADRRGSAVAPGRSDRRGGVPLRRSGLAARHAAVRRACRPHELHARGRPADARLHRVVGVGRPADSAGRGQRQLRDCGQPGARVARRRRSRSCTSSARTSATSRSRSATPTWRPRRALGLDLALRARGDRFEGEVSFFRNDINNFIFRNPIGEEEFEEREERVRRPFRRGTRGGRRRPRPRRRPAVRGVRGARRGADGRGGARRREDHAAP